MISRQDLILYMKVANYRERTGVSRAVLPPFVSGFCYSAAIAENWPVAWKSRREAAAIAELLSFSDGLTGCWQVQVGSAIILSNGGTHYGATAIGSGSVEAKRSANGR